MKNNDLSYTKEKEAIGILLGNFAQVLNNRETAAIAGFFDQDAVFIHYTHTFIGSLLKG